MQKLFFPLARCRLFDPHTKFLFIAVNMELAKKNALNQLFFEKMPEIANIALIGMINDQLVGFSYYNSFQNFISSVDFNITNIDVVFPDKLKNLHGYKYQIVYIGLWNQRLNFGNQEIKGDTLKGPDILFIKTVAEKQNASLSFKYIETTEKAFSALDSSDTDIIINTNVVMSSLGVRKTSINTYDTDGFCAMVPMPESRFFFDFIIKPFDLWTWLFIVLTITCCTIVWKLLNLRSTVNANSSSYYIFGFIANFLGQTIPFRENRRVQKTILQLTILLTFILSTIYQSLIITSITGSYTQTKIKAIDELIEGDYKFYVDEVFIRYSTEPIRTLPENELENSSTPQGKGF